MIEFNHPEKGWVASYDALTWAECEWINNLTGKQWYRLKEDA
jgi:hypothetical protein